VLGASVACLEDKISASATSALLREYVPLWEFINSIACEEFRLKPCDAPSGPRRHIFLAVRAICGRSGMSMISFSFDLRDAPAPRTHLRHQLQFAERPSRLPAKLPSDCTDNAPAAADRRQPCAVGRGSTEMRNLQRGNPNRSMLHRRAAHIIVAHQRVKSRGLFEHLQRPLS